MIPVANRPYVKGSIMTLAIVIAITLSGICRIIFPGTVSTSSALQALPLWTIVALNIFWVLSGFTVTWGILRGERNVEGAGLVLMVGAFLAYFVAILAFKSSSAPSVIYILGFAIGSGLRAKYVISEEVSVIVQKGAARAPRR